MALIDLSLPCCYLINIPHKIQADKMKQLVSKLANKILCKWLNIHIPKEKHPISINIRGECKYCGKVI